MADKRVDQLTYIAPADIAANDQIIVLDQSDTTDGPQGTLKRTDSEGYRSTKGHQYQFEFLSLVGLDLNRDFRLYIAEAINAQGPFTLTEPGKEFKFYTLQFPNGQLNPDEIVWTIYNVDTASLVVGGGSNDIEAENVYLDTPPYTTTSAGNPELFIDLGDIGSSTVEDAINLGDTSESPSVPWSLVQGQMFVTAIISSSQKVYLFVGDTGNYGASGGLTAVAGDFQDLTSEPGNPAKMYLNDLIDVDTTSLLPSNLDVLTFNTSTGKWEPQAPSGGTPPLKFTSDGDSTGIIRTDANDATHAPAGNHSFNISKSSIADDQGGATGTNSFASGQDTLASGDNSTANGYAGVASGSMSHAVNRNTIASGESSFAANAFNTASGEDSAAFGIQNEAPSFAELVVGPFIESYTANSSTAHDPADRAFGVGCGTSSGVRATALEVLKSGLVKAPSMDNSEVDSGPDSTLTPKGWVNSKIAVTETSDTGTTISLANVLGNYCNMASANSNTTFTTTGAVTGGWAKVLINAASEPTVTGATKITGSAFSALTDMYMIVNDNGNRVEYWFAEI